MQGEAVEAHRDVVVRGDFVKVLRWPLTMSGSGFNSGCQSGYQPLDKPLGGDFWRVQTCWGAVWCGQKPVAGPTVTPKGGGGYYWGGGSIEPPKTGDAGGAGAPQLRGTNLSIDQIDAEGAGRKYSGHWPSTTMSVPRACAHRPATDPCDSCSPDS